MWRTICYAGYLLQAVNEFDSEEEQEVGFRMHVADLAKLKPRPSKSAKRYVPPKVRQVPAEVDHRPPIAPLKIRLKTAVRSPPATDRNENKGQSLTTLLAEIVKDHRPAAMISTQQHRVYEDFHLPSEPQALRTLDKESGIVSSTLTKVKRI